MNWRDQANCVGAPPEILYTDHPHHTKRDRHPALAYCQGCPVKAECLADALTLGPLAQVFVRGGLTAEERRELLRGKRRPRSAA